MTSTWQGRREVDPGAEEPRHIHGIDLLPAMWTRCQILQRVLRFGNLACSKLLTRSYHAAPCRSDGPERGTAPVRDHVGRRDPCRLHRLRRQDSQVVGRMLAELHPRGETLVVRLMNTATHRGPLHRAAVVPPGARREHTGQLRPTSNVVGSIASAPEGCRPYDTGRLGSRWHSRAPTGRSTVSELERRGPAGCRPGRFRRGRDRHVSRRRTGPGGPSRASPSGRPRMRPPRPAAGGWPA